MASPDDTILPSPPTGPRLLVVDDDAGTREYLRELLGAHYAVTLVPDARAALDAIRREPPPDLILSDVVMPGMDGLTFLRALREDPATAVLPVLLMTGYHDEETRVCGFEAGADDFINKPFLPRELLARVRTHLDLARLRRHEGGKSLRAETEQALRDSEARFRAIVNQATAGVAEIDTSGRYTLVNQTFCDAVGYSREELLQREFRSLVYPDDLPRCLTVFEKALATGQSFTDDKRLVRKDGEVIWVSDCVSVIRPDERQPPRVVMVAIDITERKAAEAALRRSEERFRTVVDSVRDYAMFTLDVRGCVTSWNEGGVRMTHHTEAEILGQHLSVFYTPEDIAAGVPDQQLAEAVADGRSEREYWRVRKDGSRFWGDELVFSMRDADGELLGFAKICRDLSERKAAEDERARLLAAEQAARLEAEAASAAKDRFLAALSHELRTPLAPVQMALFMLRREKDLSDTAREGVEMIRRNVDLEARLIDDLLDVSRIVHGKFELALSSASLHACVLRAVEVCQGEMDDQGLELDVALAAASDGVQADAARLQQAFWCLLKNAVKFTPRGGRISVRSRNAERGIIVEVIDTGIGIEAAVLPRLFHAFEQGAPDITRVYGGLGLGLSIAYAIIQAHGGRLTAASDGPGRGAALAVELPLLTTADAV